MDPMNPGSVPSPLVDNLKPLGNPVGQGTPRLVASNSLEFLQDGPIPQARVIPKRGRSSLSVHAALSSHAEVKEESWQTAQGHAHQANLPILLTLFVCFIALFAGGGVACFHYLVKYSGCALGINGCNKFGNDESHGYYLVRAVSDVFGPSFPEEWVYVLVCTLGSGLVGLLIAVSPQWLQPQLSGGGTTQALAAVASGRVIPWPTIFLKPMLTSLYLGCGASMGGEGPAGQLCTSISGVAGQMLGINTPGTQPLLAALGVCCGFAASFNAP
eukprot:CAMPEP_0115148898 /NCGR_PEP_ID=MMETSP0227-20121206/64143_1 /TAXON_ID=89957 /ORGANISM="Polarella glacialis, Strain CCMP 1383" /LENGTH=271 /DNA_ID=CAMNT_0002559011 /DNA_START=1 /DNA_END=812 /DNA_ORIENTATION=-